MRPLFLTTILAVSSSLLSAEFTYQQTTQMTGGALLNMMKMGGPFTRQAREPVVSTHIIKGNRMVTLTKDHASIIDLDKESITQIDFNKKTYSVMTFAEMKQAMDAGEPYQTRLEPPPSDQAAAHEPRKRVDIQV